MNPNDYPVYPEEDGTDAKEILIALYEAVARFGCGLIGIPYKE